ncbi:hypothetical protein M407DRAFT_6720 [Tulasnella calospora MUT 4182]|uniref:Uncharacterized protein n=1 Tax=Tulasnella calospora MUT 4182 TaxID=1051891 RepID=A0A0C3QCQ3_9AGAM|nr:hypothetical protein M407DRAFT_6720 [Tulasnella calospora MUT 4182]
MPPRARPATSTGYQICPHCDRYLSRSTVWRHLNYQNIDAALIAGLNLPSEPDPLPAPNPLPEPDPLPEPISLPSSPVLGDISITSTDRALSPINLGDLDEEDLAILGAGFELSNTRTGSPDDEAIQELSMWYEGLELVEEDDLQGEDGEEDGYDNSLDCDYNNYNNYSNYGFNSNNYIIGGEEPQDHVGEFGEPEMEVDTEPTPNNVSVGGGGVDLSSFWEGLPGGAQGNAVNDRDEDEGEATLVSATVNPEGSVSSRPSTPSTTTSNPSVPLAPSLPIPELVRLWDLQTARHRD